MMSWAELVHFHTIPMSDETQKDQIKELKTLLAIQIEVAEELETKATTADERTYLRGRKSAYIEILNAIVAQDPAK